MSEIALIFQGIEQLEFFHLVASLDSCVDYSARSYTCIQEISAFGYEARLEWSLALLGSDRAVRWTIAKQGRWSNRTHNNPTLAYFIYIIININSILSQTRGIVIIMEARASNNWSDCD